MLDRSVDREAAYTAWRDGYSVSEFAAEAHSAPPLVPPDAAHHCPTGLSSPVDNDRQDFTIYSGDWAMSRIYEQRGGPDHMRWCWSL